MKNRILKLLAFVKTYVFESISPSNETTYDADFKKKWWMGEEMFSGNDKKLPET